MTITNMTLKKVAGRVANLQPYHHTVKFTGDAAYPDGGWPGIKALLQAAVGLKIDPIAVQAVNCGAYLPQLTETPPAIQTAPASWPIDDLDGLTMLYKLNGADEATHTFGTTTSQAHLAAELDAIAGVHAYADDDSEVTFKTDEVGPDASFEITGGTALVKAGLAVGEHVGTEDLLLRINAVATGADAGANDPSLDLSAVTFELLVVSN